MKLTLEGSPLECIELLLNLAKSSPAATAEAQVKSKISEVREAVEPVVKRMEDARIDKNSKLDTGEGNTDEGNGDAGEEGAGGRIISEHWMTVRQTEHDRTIMNALVDHPESTSKEIADRLGMTRQKVSYILRSLELEGLVQVGGRKQKGVTVSTFTPRPVNRDNSRPLPEGVLRRDGVLEIIRAHPGSTTTEIGMRLLMATTWVSSATVDLAKEGILERTGTGSQNDPYRWYEKGQVVVRMPDRSKETVSA